MKRTAATRDTYDARLIRRARDLCDWTQTELAKRLRVDRVSVARWEKGNRTPSLEMVARIQDLVTDHQVRRLHRMREELARMHATGDEGQGLLEYATTAPETRQEVESFVRLYLRGGITVLGLQAIQLARQVEALKHDRDPDR